MKGAGNPRPPFEVLGRHIWRYYQHRACAQVATAIKDGTLPRPESQPCVHCGGPALIYEHRSYHQPLDVRPACDSCNRTLPPAVLDPQTVIDHLCGRAVFPYAADAEQYPSCPTCAHAYAPFPSGKEAVAPESVEAEA